MKRWYGIFAALAFAVLIAGCDRNTSVQGGRTQSGEETASAENAEKSSDAKAEKSLFAMDTYMTLTAYGEHAQEALEEAAGEIQRLDELLSTGNENSEVSLLNDHGKAAVSEDVAILLERSLELYQSTGGIFDITIYPVMNLWGFPSQEYRVPAETEIQAVLKNVGSDKLSYDKDTGICTIQEGMAIDFGGIAKGYTSSLLMEVFKKYGVSSAMVSLGGNVQVLGTKPDGSDWRVAVRNPDGSDAYLGVLEISDKAVITSGGYERYFEEQGVIYHHIMDVRTGKPADSDLTSVTIVSGDGTLADGLSTSLFVMGKDGAVDYWRKNADRFDAVLVTEDGKIYVTEGLEEKFSSDFSYDIVK